MALTKITTKWNDETHRREVTSREVQYVGRVVATDYKDCVQIMSDVWCTMYWAIVLTDDGEYKHICTGNSEFGSDEYENVTVDATPEMVATYKAFLAERARLAEERRQAEERARVEAEYLASLKVPERGRRVKFVAGRPVLKKNGSTTKIAKGTEGVVIWTGSGDYGPRVGVAITDNIDPETGKHTDVVWTAEGNVEALLEGNDRDEVNARINAWKEAWVAARDIEATKDKVRRDAEYTTDPDAEQEVPF